MLVLAMQSMSHRALKHCAVSTLACLPGVHVHPLIILRQTVVAERPLRDVDALPAAETIWNSVGGHRSDTYLFYCRVNRPRLCLSMYFDFYAFLYSSLCVSFWFYVGVACCGYCRLSCVTTSLPASQPLTSVASRVAHWLVYLLCCCSIHQCRQHSSVGN